jgi:hypothetical protein
MDRLTVKRSTVFVAVGKKTRVFRSVEEVPRDLRKRLEESTSGMNSATILIADRRGRAELARAIRGLPSTVESRLANNLRSQRQEAAPPAPRRFQFPRWARFLVPGVLALLAIAVFFAVR